MGLPVVFQNFPNQPTYSILEHDYKTISDLADWEWSYSGHTPPDALNDVDGGSILLGSGSAGAGDYLAGQVLGSSVRLNRLAKTFYWQWVLQLDSAALTECLVGCNITNTNPLNSNITDGFGFYCNSPGGPAAGTWYAYLAFDSTIQYTSYTQATTGVATDALTHTLSMRIITDPSTLGAGSIAWWIDGNPCGSVSSSSTAILPHDELLRMSIAMGNVSAVARTVTLYEDRNLDQR